LIDRLCPLCGESHVSSLFAEACVDPARLGEFAYASRKLPEYMHHRLMHCSRCDVIYASPVPDTSELESAYEAAAFDSQQESAYAARTYIRSLRSVCDRLPDRFGALDIGAGDGAFCGELKSIGFSSVTGLEPSSAPIAAAAENVRECLQQEMFGPGLFPPGQFSLVTCFQTIEHVSSPAELCREAVRLLKPGGALCLVAHNRRALSCRLLGRRSPIFDIEHLQLFSPESLKRLLADAGLRSVVAKRLYNQYPISYWTRLFPFPSAIKTALLWSLRTSGIGGIPLTLPAGNLLAWGFR
jgi:SAM-dependent methyltransferase